MNLLASFSDLVEYKNDIIAQREVLKVTKAFTAGQKIELEQIYNDMETVVTNRINQLQDLQDAVNL